MLAPRWPGLAVCAWCQQAVVFMLETYCLFAVQVVNLMHSRSRFP